MDLQALDQQETASWIIILQAESQPIGFLMFITVLDSVGKHLLKSFGPLLLSREKRKEEGKKKKQPCEHFVRLL